MATYYRDSKIGIEIVFGGTNITALAQLIIAFVIGMVMIQGYQWNSGRKMRGQDQVAMKPSEYRIGHYLHSLPISNAQMALRHFAVRRLVHRPFPQYCWDCL
ncbi:MAG UNVERIFIED_CONTAM: hypothetical protein LVR29_14210 [Microcystis novacekii LVE1205-3]